MGANATASGAPAGSAPAGRAETGNAPPDADTVRLALRLGWVLAELRGRYWWQGTPPATAPLPVDPPFALPLRPERTPAESRAQVCEAVVALARRLAVAEPFAAGEHGTGLPFPDRLEVVLAPLEADSAQLLSPPGTPGIDVAKRDAAWAGLALLVHEWDAQIQDGLTARADVLCNAYLLGRGLSECYWTLGPDVPAPGSAQEGRTVATDWTFLFGYERRCELSRLVGRIAGHLDALTPAAVSGSIEAWGAVAGDPGWRGDATSRAKLYEQLRRWYELLVLARDPTTFVKPYAVLRGWRTTRHAFRSLWPQLALALASAAAVGVLVWFLSTGRGTAGLNVLLGLFGGLGLSAAAVVGKAKNVAQQLLTRLRQDAYSDLVAIAVTCIPDLPGAGGKVTDRRLQEAVAARPLTTSTPLLDTGRAGP